MSILTAASAKTAWRGFEYYQNQKVCYSEKLDESHYGGVVKGSSSNPYKVVIDLEHPKRSTCDCPFANGHKVCKHMVAVFFEAFPEEAYWYKFKTDQENEEAERYWEELPDRIEQCVNRLTVKQLRELVFVLINELPEDEVERFVMEYIEPHENYDEVEEEYYDEEDFEDEEYE